MLMSVFGIFDSSKKKVGETSLRSDYINIRKYDPYFCILCIVSKEKTLYVDAMKISYRSWIRDHR